MPPDPHKRELRELKRAIKRRGNKHRRQVAKRTLAENPDAAAETDDAFGRHTSVNWNGQDKDATRRKPEE